MDFKSINLTYGQVVNVSWDKSWGEKPNSKFTSNIRYLNRNNIPKIENLPGKAGENVIYDFYNTMELCLAMALKSKGYNVRHIKSFIDKYRDELNKLYETAYKSKEHLFLIIDMKSKEAYDDNNLSYKEPKLINKEEAGKFLLEHKDSWMLPDLVSLGKMTKDIVSRAHNEPEKRRGRR